MQPLLNQIAINPLQWVASDDGWIDPSLAPPLEERLRHIAEAGFVAVHTDVPGEMSTDDYRSSLEAAGLVPAPGYIAALLTEDVSEQQIRLDRAKRTAEIHAELGVDVVFLAMGMAHGAPRVEHPGVGYAADQDTLAHTRDLLEEFATTVQTFGVTPAFHPHVGTWVETDAETRFVLDTIDPSVLAFGPDVGHLAWADADPIKLIVDYRERVAALHIKDFQASVAAESKAADRSYRETVRAGLWAEPGLGTNDIADVFAALEDDFSGWFIVEVDRGAQVTPEESVRLCGEWARRVAR